MSCQVHWTVLSVCESFQTLWKKSRFLLNVKKKKITFQIVFEKKNIGYRFREIYFLFDLHYFCVFEKKSPKTMIYDTQYQND